MKNFEPPVGEISWFQPPRDADSVISIEYYSELVNHESEYWDSQFGKSWHGENIPIIPVIQIEKAKLSVYFRRARTFLAPDLVTLIKTRYNTVCVRWLPDPYEIPKTWNLA